MYSTQSVSGRFDFSILNNYPDTAISLVQPTRKLAIFTANFRNDQYICTMSWLLKRN